MADKKNMETVWAAKQTAWIKGCPLRITEIKICRETDSGSRYLFVTTSPCTDKKITGYSAKILYYNTHRELVAEDMVSDLAPLSASLKIYHDDVEYVTVIISEVNCSGNIWRNLDGVAGKKLLDQEVIWQTDPLYAVIKEVCRGKTNPKYYPDETDGGWRCTCGGINTSDSSSCSNCGVSKGWLYSAFDKEYLLSQKSLVNEGKKPKAAERLKKKEAERLISDKTKMILIFASIIIFVILAVLSMVYIVPQTKYNKAHEYAILGEYDKAIEIFEDLGRFKNSEELVKTFTYEKFVYLTGVEDLYITSSEEIEWLSITDDGVITFAGTKYKGDFSDFKIPHVFNGIIVRELDKNFIINCSSLTSITIPDTVEIIGDQAFMNCTSLERITFGKSLTTIMPRAFINCSSLEEIIVPDTVVSLGQRAFNNCRGLKHIYLGSGITEIEAYAFSNCANLEKITLASPITEIGEYALNGCEKLVLIECMFDESEWTDPKVGEENDQCENISVIFK